jgi:hypothetical protein
MAGLTDDQLDRLVQMRHCQRELTGAELAELAAMRRDAEGEDLALVVALERQQDRLRRDRSTVNDVGRRRALLRLRRST